MITCTPLPVRAFRYTGATSTNVLPSPVFISAILPWCITIPPINCTLYWRIPNFLFDTSLTTAKASINMSSKVSPLFNLFLNTLVISFNSSSDKFCISSSKASILSTIKFNFLISCSSALSSIVSKTDMYFLPPFLSYNYYYTLKMWNSRQLFLFIV